MTPQFSLDRHAATPLTDQLVTALLAQIDAGTWPVGHKLPSVRQAAGQWGVSTFTVAAAYDRLVGQQRLLARPGAGYFVALLQRGGLPAGRLADWPTSLQQIPGAVEGLAVGDTPAAAMAMSDDAAARQVGFALRLHPQDPAQTLPLGSGFLPSDWLADALPVSLLTQATREHARHLAEPASAQGWPPLLAALSYDLANKGIRLPAQRLLTTVGASHGYNLIVRCLCRPGDAVLVEDPGYLVHYPLLRSWGLRLLVVPRRWAQADADESGPDLDRLEALAAEHKPVLMLTQAALHNPTGTTMAPTVAHRLLMLADKYNFRIVEDDVHGDLAPGQALRLAALDARRGDLHRVLYLGSYAKTLSPALRVGFLAAPQALVPTLLAGKSLGVLSSASLPEAIVAAALRSGRYHEHLQALRRRLARFRQQAVQAVSGAGWLLDAPNAQGMFVWARLPQGLLDTLPAGLQTLVDDAQAHGILLAAQQLFSPDEALLQREQPLCNQRLHVGYAADPRFISWLQRWAWPG